MRRILAAVALIPVMLLAEEPPAPKPNTLTPKAITDGWLLLFDGETTFGWKIDGEAKVEKGVLVLGGTKETFAEPTSLFQAFHVSFEAAWDGDGAANFGTGLDAGLLKGGPSPLGLKPKG